MYIFNLQCLILIFIIILSYCFNYCKFLLQNLIFFLHSLAIFPNSAIFNTSTSLAYTNLFYSSANVGII
nr:MAG TPA: hypothetical protein [Caudoviricetes sp.]